MRDVTVVRVVSQGSVEERILEMQVPPTCPLAGLDCLDEWHSCWAAGTAAVRSWRRGQQQLCLPPHHLNRGGLVEDKGERVERMCKRVIGIILPNNQQQHHASHIQKDVLRYAFCLLLFPVSAALASIFWMDSISTSYKVDGIQTSVRPTRCLLIPSSLM